jgi:hypothetical protein
MPHTLPALFSDLAPAAESLVLDRFALLDDVKALGETWFLARVFGLLRADGVEAVATFSDPWPRRDRHGRTVHVGHIGTVLGLGDLHRPEPARDVPSAPRDGRAGPSARAQQGPQRRALERLRRGAAPARRRPAAVAR